MTTTGSFADLVIQFGDVRGITSLPDDRGGVEITIANQGEERVEGRFGVNLYGYVVQNALLPTDSLNVLNAASIM
ncbi:hypothetical protein [Scytonema sp. NUACC26]|uniref:hypothetical protein n=1 Tax=Scytonema sp. NUACC26 TaxID=3140176 RepID=UPI0034DC2DBF